MCFYKLFTGTWVSKDFQFWLSGSRNNQERTALSNISFPHSIGPYACFPFF